MSWYTFLIKTLTGNELHRIQAEDIYAAKAKVREYGTIVDYRYGLY
jgi:hypothetical protein